MNKSLKKYSSAKWIDTRLSNPYKVRLTLKGMKSMLITEQAQAHINLIVCQSAPLTASSAERAEFNARKTLAIAKVYTDSIKAIGNLAVK